MKTDIEQLNEVLDKEFPNLKIGEKEDMIIRQWLAYAEIHMREHPCPEFRNILRIRTSQMIEILNR